MGAWGAGSFENDDAMDFVGGLTAANIEQQLAAAFTAVQEDTGHELDAGISAEALAAADLIAAARGHASGDLPDAAAEPIAKLKVSAELQEAACEAVSRVLLSSELLELWAESDEAEEWSRAMTGLVERLSAPVRKQAKAKKSKNKETAAQCSFCLEQISESELVEIALSKPMISGTMDRSIYAHAACLNAKLHPSRMVQWWRAEI